MTSLLKKLLFSSVSIRLLSVMVGFVTSIFVNRSLGLELRGEYTEIFTFATLFQSALNLGIAFAYVPLQRSEGVDRSKTIICTLVWIQFVINLILSGLFLCLSFSWENAFICMLACLMITNGQIVFVSLIDNITSRNRILLLSALLYLFSNIIVFVLMKHCLEAILFLLLFKYLFEILACGFRQRCFIFRPSSIGRRVLKTVLSIGLPTALLSFLITFNYNIDVVVMGAMDVDDLELGIFGVAYTLSNMLWFIPDAFKEYVYHKSAKELSPRDVLALVACNMVLCLFLCLAFAIFGKWVLDVLYGKEYVLAYGTTLTIFFGIIPMIAFKLIHPIYVNKGKPLSVVLLLSLSIILNLVVAFFLIPAYGAMGAAIACVSAYSLCGMLFLAKYTHDEKISIKEVPLGVKELLKSQG